VTLRGGEFEGEVVCAVVPPDDGGVSARLAAQLAKRLDLPLALVGLRIPVPPIAGAPLAGPQPVAPPLDLPASSAEPSSGEERELPPPADLARLVDLAGTVPVRTDTVLAAPSDALVALSEAPRTALVVTRDEGGDILRGLFGAAPARAGLRAAACPLVLASSHARTDLPPAPTVVAGVDEDDQAPTVAEVAGALARGLGGRLRLVHVVAPDAGEALADLAEREQASLVVVGRPHRGTLGAAVLGSAVHDLLDATPSTPVVVVPAD